MGICKNVLHRQHFQCQRSKTANLGTSSDFRRKMLHFKSPHGLVSNEIDTCLGMVGWLQDWKTPTAWKNVFDWQASEVQQLMAFDREHEGTMKWNEWRLGTGPNEPSSPWCCNHGCPGFFADVCSSLDVMIYAKWVYQVVGLSHRSKPCIFK